MQSCLVEENSQPKPFRQSLTCYSIGKELWEGGGKRKQQESYLNYSLSVPVLFGKPGDQLLDLWDFVRTVFQHMTLRECYFRG